MDLLNYDDEMICPTCNGIGRIKKRDKTISDLTLSEFKNLKEYNRLTAKPITISDISTRNGEPVPKEW